MADKLLPFVGKNFSAVLIRLIGAASGILCIILISRHYGADTLGIVSFAQRAYQLILIVAVFGFREVIIKEYPSTNISKRDEVFASSLGIAAITALSITIIINVIPTEFIDDIFETRDAGIFIKIFSWGLTFHILSKILSFVLVSLKKLPLSLLLDGALINGILLILMVFYWQSVSDLNYLHLGLIFLASRLINWFYAIKVARKNEIRLFKFNFKQEILTKSKSFFSISALYNLIQNVDLIVVAFFLGPAELGIYAAASRISIIIKLLTFVFNTGLMPELQEAYSESKDWKKVKNATFRNAKVGIMVGSAFILVQFLFGRQLLNLFGDGFDAGYEVLIVISFCSVLQFTFSPFQVFLKMLGHEKKLIQILLSCLILLIVSLTIGTIKFGLLGASISLLVCFLLLYGLELFTVLRIIKQKI
ncbi:lipopolysaccharide biosynthesis protein [Ekhidna sp.]